MWCEVLKYCLWFYLACKFISMITMGRCKSKKRMVGKTVLITGANGGIGKETTRDLAMRGARLIMACRNLRTANEARDEIIKETGNTDIIVLKLDLSDFNQIREFAKEVYKTENRIDVLIHCCGIAANNLKNQFNNDSIDITFATNHLGSFLLTHLLIDLMKKSERSRIVVISSIAHMTNFTKFSNFNVKDLPKIGFLDRYSLSKYANALFTKELARRLKTNGITANCLHPGVVLTYLTDNLDLWLRIVYRIFKWSMKSNEEGAQTVLHLSVSDDVANVSGKYFIDCKETAFCMGLKEESNAKDLWMLSEDLVQLTSEERTIKDV